MRGKAFSIFVPLMMVMCFFFWFLFPDFHIGNNMHGRTFFPGPLGMILFIGCALFFFFCFIFMCFNLSKKSLWSRMCNGDWGSDASLDIRKENYQDILKTRLAKGEISEEEFDRLKEKLTKE